MEPNITRVIGCVIDPIQKGVKINGCYQFNNVDAPWRIDYRFLTYCVIDKLLDEHILDPLDQSQFLRLDDEGMLASFAIDPLIFCCFLQVWLQFLRKFEGLPARAKEMKVNLTNYSERNLWALRYCQWSQDWRRGRWAWQLLVRRRWPENQTTDKSRWYWAEEQRGQLYPWW